MKFAALLLSMLGLLLGARTALATEPSPTRFAVVIGNNHSLSTQRPDLHYADDDAARYYAILQTLAPGQVSLLANFDRDSARLFSESAKEARLPTRAELSQVGRSLTEHVTNAARTGAETELYFVFAGHGDVDQGTGFIELQDGRFTAQDLEAWLKAIPFTRAHVILDSCNSFFMLGVRQPGGRRFATGDDAVRSLAGRLPNVGVFLSTSAEGEAFEWSEIQSGIFSHVVRSGLLGAADANADDSVSYLELAAFVATATRDVANPNMRPNVYARGPGARDDAVIADLKGRSGARHFELKDSTALRIRVRDREGLPLLDAHAAAGTRLSLALPRAWSTGAVVERAEHAGVAPLALYTVPETPEHVQLASLEPLAARGESRGPADVFQRLFASPFGPRAVAEYAAERKSAPTQVFGVSRADALRMELVLAQIAGAERDQRILGGLALLGAGGVVTGAGGTLLYYGDRLDGMSNREAHNAGGIFLGLGALYLAGGGYLLAAPSSGEEAERDFRRVIAEGGDYARAFAAADERLQTLIAAERRARWGRGIIGGSLFLLGSGAVLGSELANVSPDERFASRTLGGTVGLFGGVMLGGALLTESPAERLTNVFRSPDFVSVQPSISFGANGAMFGLSGTF